ncbi:MAG TPA: metallophosphoesterase family protein [Thermoanaerobaculia bacterium]|nr:metallophosphoesterase family protein [Thermoanaerobaculia bacterium]
MDAPSRRISVVLFALLFALLSSLAFEAFAGGTPLVARRSLWRYLDTGTDPGTAWTSLSYNDASWKSGYSELGYGDGDEATVVGFGPDSSQRFITTHFRQTFTVANPASIASLRLRVLRDDGAVIYINGTEVFRTNMPAGAITYTTPASGPMNDVEEVTYVEITLPASVLRAGTNVIAAEVHQSAPISTDLSFAVELLATDSTTTPNLTRGPYLQQASPTSVVVRWRTDTPGTTRVRYGTALNQLNATVDKTAPTTEHSVTLTGLAPATKYFYAVETLDGRVNGGTADFFFITSPLTSAAARTRIWVLGDAGTGSANATAVRNAYYNAYGVDSTNFVLFLGDNAYQTGLDEEYQRGLFKQYEDVMRNSPAWPTIGNHDTAHSTAPPPDIPYFQNFTLPANGEAGGVASGTEKYYSFDYGNMHFICLDSQTSDRTGSGPMVTWLRNDLAATRQPWIIAYWHHPPYSKGSHDSDTETALVEMRQYVVPVLEQGGADLVLTGHSHSYERSYLLNGHYGHSTTFTTSMKLNGGNGRTDGTGAYRKGTTATSSFLGTVYAVSGSAAMISGGALDHPAMITSLNELGSMVLEVEGDKLEAIFLRNTGQITDRFTIDKSNAPEPRRRRRPSGS